MQHIRNGTELPPLGSKMHYSFEYQSQDPVARDTSVILPGDLLVTSCTYDSTQRTNVTKWVALMSPAVSAAGACAEQV